MKVLIDRNIEINAVTHKTMLARQVIRWGPKEQIIDVAQRKHFPPRDDESFRLEQLPYLATLCNFAKEGKLEFLTSHELRMEKLRQKGYCDGYLGINLLRGVPVKFVRCPVERSIVIGPTSIGTTEDEQTRFFESIQHPRFLQIRNAIEAKHIDDAFHLWTAEEAGLDVFLTMDKKFWRAVKQKRKMINSAIPVMTPNELCKRLNAQPTDIEKLAAETNPFS